MRAPIVHRVAPDGHDCVWKYAELRRDAEGNWWVRDECAHDLSGKWFRRDGEPGEPPWPQIGDDDGR